MIRINYFFILLSATLYIFSSCSKEKTVLNVTTNQLEFTYEGGAQTITVESDDDWSLYGLPSWLEASRISGINSQQIILTAQRNTTGLDREQTLSIRSNNSTNVQTINVKQYANSAGQIFFVDNTSVKYFNGTTSEREDSIVLSSSVRWRITGPSWLSMNFKGESSPMTGEIREGSGVIYLRCSKSNTEEETRKDVITLQTEYGDETMQIPVEQMGLYDVKCVNMYVLSDGFWFSYKYGYNIEYITTGNYEGIVSPEEKSGAVWGKIGKNNTVSIYNLTPNTYYTVMMRGMPTESTVYKKVNAEVVRTATDENQPRAEICDIFQNDNGTWNYRIVMNEYAKGYYRAAFKSTTGSKTNFARSLYNAIGTENVAYEEKDISSTRGDGTVIAWAVGKDGTLSNVVDIYKFISSNNSYAPVWQTQSEKDSFHFESVDKANMEIPE